MTGTNSLMKCYRRDLNQFIYLFFCVENKTNLEHMQESKTNIKLFLKIERLRLIYSSKETANLICQREKSKLSRLIIKFKFNIVFQ